MKPLLNPTVCCLQLSIHAAYTSCNVCWKSALQHKFKYCNTLAGLIGHVKSIEVKRKLKALFRIQYPLYECSIEYWPVNSCQLYSNLSFTAKITRKSSPCYAAKYQSEQFRIVAAFFGRCSLIAFYPNIISCAWCSIVDSRPLCASTGHISVTLWFCSICCS